MEGSYIVGECFKVSWMKKAWTWEGFPDNEFKRRHSRVRETWSFLHSVHSLIHDLYSLSLSSFRSFHPFIHSLHFSTNFLPVFSSLITLFPLFSPHICIPFFLRKVASTPQVWLIKRSNTGSNFDADSYSHVSCYASDDGFRYCETPLLDPNYDTATLSSVITSNYPANPLSDGKNADVCLPFLTTFFWFHPQQVQIWSIIQWLTYPCTVLNCHFHHLTFMRQQREVWDRVKNQNTEIPRYI